MWYDRGMELREGEVVEELLIGDLKIIQNTRLYRFTSDSVLLSRFASAKAHERVADLCAGSGIVGLHYYALHPETTEQVTLFEMQEALSEMSARTIALNGAETVLRRLLPRAGAGRGRITRRSRSRCATRPTSAAGLKKRRLKRRSAARRSP